MPSPGSKILNPTRLLEKGNAIRKERDSNSMAAPFYELNDRFEQAGLTDLPIALDPTGFKSKLVTDALNSKSKPVIQDPRLTSTTRKLPPTGLYPSAFTAMRPPETVDRPKVTKSIPLPPLPLPQSSSRKTPPNNHVVVSPLRIDDETCQGCHLPLGFGDFFQLPTSRGLYHKPCFPCTKCDKSFEDGKFVPDEDGKSFWHFKVCICFHR